jgi:hypothetical protein
MRRILALAAALLCSTAAYAGTGTITVLDSAGATKTYAVTTNGAAAFIQQMVTCDGTAAAQCAAVKPASTAAVAADPALVVSVSPNNTVGVTESGTWTVQPGNTANTTAWLVTGTGGVFPATQSGTWTVQPGNTANTTPWLVAPSGSVNNGSSGIATTATNSSSVVWNYGFNGATWDALTTTAFNSTASTGRGLMTNTWVANAATPGRTITGLNALGASPVVQPSAPNTATGGTPFPIVNATSSANATLIKNTPTVLFGCQMGNNSTSIAYLHIFNKASAAPTPGTDGAIKTLIIPGPAAGGGGSNANFGPGGIALSLGFGITITAGIGTVDNTTIATANQIVVNCDFE